MPRKYIRRGRGLSRQARRILDYLSSRTDASTPEIAAAVGQTNQAAARTLWHYDALFEVVGEGRRGNAICNVWALREKR